MERKRQPDRNREQGGRSFYFFDFDDNVMFLGTSIFVFDRDTGEERALSTAEYAAIQEEVGRPGPWERYRLVLDDRKGSFRRCRDRPGDTIQPFVQDLKKAIARPADDWMGPSWDFFWYAVHNRRPVAIITARGHEPATIENGIGHLYEAGLLSEMPNYLGIFPVTHPATRERLSVPATVPHLKRAAILESVKTAMRIYGASPYHRFGMSDDDPQNIELIVETMRELKELYPENSFFVIDARRMPVVKREVLAGSVTSETVPREQQLELFG